MSQDPIPSRRRRSPRVSILTILNIAAGLVLVIAMLHIVASAFTRTVLGLPIPATNEVITYWSMPAMVFIGFVAAQIVSEQIEVSLVFDRLHRSLKIEFEVIALVLVAVLCAAFSWYTLQEALHAANIQKTGGVVGIPIWPFAFLAPTAFLGMTLSAVVDIIRVISGRKLVEELRADDERAAESTDEEQQLVSHEPAGTVRNEGSGRGADTQ